MMATISTLLNLCNSKKHLNIKIASSFNKLGGELMKSLGWAALILGILLVIIFAYVGGSSQQIVQTILGILTAIVGITYLVGK